MKRKDGSMTGRAVAADVDPLTPAAQPQVAWLQAPTCRSYDSSNPLQLGRRQR